MTTTVAPAPRNWTFITVADHGSNATSHVDSTANSPAYSDFTQAMH